MSIESVLLWQKLEVVSVINTIEFILLLCCFVICIYCVYISIKLDTTSKDKKKEITQKETTIKKIDTDNYVKPMFKKLTQEQIDDIHARGKITPAEMVKEWEGMDLCAPGDAIGSAAWRCEKFHNCHDCLVDYANEHDEYTSFCEIIKLCSPYKLYECKENEGVDNAE